MFFVYFFMCWLFDSFLIISTCSVLQRNNCDIILKLYLDYFKLYVGLPEALKIMCFQNVVIASTYIYIYIGPWDTTERG